MIEFNERYPIGFAQPATGSSKDDKLSPAEKQLLERIADQLLRDHGDTLKKLGDE